MVAILFTVSVVLLLVGGPALGQTIADVVTRRGSGGILPEA